MHNVTSDSSHGVHQRSAVFRWDSWLVALIAIGELQHWAPLRRGTRRLQRAAVARVWAPITHGLPYLTSSEVLQSPALSNTDDATYSTGSEGVFKGYAGLSCTWERADLWIRGGVEEGEGRRRTDLHGRWEWSPLTWRRWASVTCPKWQERNETVLAGSGAVVRFV